MYSAPMSNEDDHDRSDEYGLKGDSTTRHAVQGGQSREPGDPQTSVCGLELTAIVKEPWDETHVDSCGTCRNRLANVDGG